MSMSFGISLANVSWHAGGDLPLRTLPACIVALGLCRAYRNRRSGKAPIMETWSQEHGLPEAMQAQSQLSLSEMARISWAAFKAGAVPRKGI